MLKVFILGFMLSSAAFANHLEKVCETATTANPVWEEGLVAYRDLSTREFHITSHGGMIIASSSDAIRGVIQDGLSIWALTARYLIETNATGEVVNSYEVEDSGLPYIRALSMVRAGNILVISRGAGGLIGFDLTKREIVWTNRMSGDDEGFPSALAFNGSKVYAAAATSQENGFTGIITIDPVSGMIERRVAYDVARWGVLDVDAKARMHGESLVLNNGGWIHVITKAQLEGSKKIRPRWVAQVVPQNGSVNQHYLMLSGEFLVEDGYVKGCGVYTAFEEGSYVRKSRLSLIKLP